MKNLDLVPEKDLIFLFQDAVEAYVQQRHRGLYHYTALSQAEEYKVEILRRLCAPELFQLRMQSA